MRVYLDHNATTALRPEARAELLLHLDALGGNPSSVHRSGRAARAVLDSSRERVAAALAVAEDEVFFTSGGTEAVHLAVLGALRAAEPGAGLVTSPIEHSAVLESAKALEAAGHPVARIDVDHDARLDLEACIAAVRGSNAGLVSLMAANNEVGALLPIGEVVSRLGRGSAGGTKPGRPWVHTDAVQALGRIPFAPRELGVDLASFSAHKVGGPLGVGVLYRRRGLPLAPLAHGGGQEGGLRPGTENVPAIAAAAVAIELAVAELDTSHARLAALTRSLWSSVASSIPGVRLNGPPLDARDRLPNTLNVSFANTDGRTLVARLDLEGLELSAGSACASGSIEPSHVLLAMGRSQEDARAAVRMSLGHTTSAADVHNAVEILRRVLCVSQQVRSATQACEASVKTSPPLG